MTNAALRVLIASCKHCGSRETETKRRTCGHAYDFYDESGRWHDAEQFNLDDIQLKTVYCRGCGRPRRNLRVIYDAKQRVVNR